MLLRATVKFAVLGVVMMGAILLGGAGLLDSCWILWSCTGNPNYYDEGNLFVSYILMELLTFLSARFCNAKLMNHEQF